MERVPRRRGRFRIRTEPTFQTSIYITEALHDRVREMAIFQKVTLSEFARRALERYCADVAVRR